jgi:hypothetical protein
MYYLMRGSGFVAVTCLPFKLKEIESLVLISLILVWETVGAEG